MRWKSLFVAICFCALGALSWAQEPPSPPATSPLEATEIQPSVSQRLRQIAERLRQATIDSQSDLEALLQEQQALLLELKELQIAANDSEREARFMKDSYETSSSSLTSSMLKEEQERKAKARWRTTAIVEAILIAGAALLL